MIKKILLVLSPLLFSAFAFAATRTEKPVAENATHAVAAPGGVLINATTRNASTSKVTLQLAQDGKALLPIVISDKASTPIKLVAGELKKYLDAMSGASFEIQTGDGTAGIVLGNKTEFPTPALDKALEIAHGFEGKEAYAIRTREKKVLLLGATDLGASHAAYRLLEELGCRWFFPNDDWEVVPSTPDLKFDKDITDRPTFGSRSIWYAWSNFHDAGHPQSTPEHPRNADSDYADWMRRNHMAESFHVLAGHSYEAIVATFPKEFAAHPEYFALQQQADGTMKRGGGQLDWGNAGVRKLVTDYAIKFFKDNPNADMVSVDPSDGAGISQSPEAKAYAAPNDAPFKLANEVAVALQGEFPGQNKMVGLYAYNWHSDPPPFPLEPNVYVQLTMAFNSGKLTLDQLFEEWPKKARNLGFYDYYSTWRWDFDMWPGGRVAAKSYAIDKIRLFQKINRQSGAYATSISSESSNNWGVNGRGYYLANKLMWNPDLNPDDILQDFYDRAFGPAASIMKEYYELQDAPPPIAPGVVGALFRILQRAREAAKNDEAVMKRLDDIVSYLRYYDLNFRNQREADAAKKAAQVLEIQTLMYRNRYSYMNHWEAFRQDSIKEDYHPNDPKPWKIDAPIKREEINSWLADAIAFYPELKIPTRVAFSKDLVPVNTGGASKEWVSPTYQAGTPQWTLYSLHGEPIRITLISYAQYGGGKLSYQLKDEKGGVLAHGEPQGTEKGTRTELNVNVPAPGRYYLSYTDGSGSMYGFVVPKDQPFAFDMTTIQGSTLGGDTPDLYFYVPKGTRSVDYYFTRTDWSNSGPHMVVDGNGTIQAKFNVLADYLSVPVPAGTDGAAWHFTGDPNAGAFGLGRFTFFTVPNVLSTSPAQLFVPRELLKKDGLKLAE